MAAATMKPYTPRPWAPLMTNHMVEHSRCAVWSPMGSGKTVTTLTALESIDANSGNAYPALALGPLRVARKVWSEETQKWKHTKHIEVSKAIGDADERKAALTRDAQVYAINYENVDWLVRQYRDKPWPFRTIISDESRKLKTFRLKQGGSMTKALGEVAWSPAVKHFIQLTGTPSPNGLKDLWGQLWFLDQGHRLGHSFKAFEERWFGYKRIQDALGKTHVQSVIQKGADAEIHDRVRDLCLSIDLREWVDIKEPVLVPVKVELPPVARRLYREMEKALFIKIEQHEIEAFSAGAKTMKLLQLASGAAYLDPDVENDEDPRARAYKVVHDAKIEALESVIEEVGDAPVIVAVQFKSDITRLLKAIPGSRLLKSEKDEDDFKAGLIPVLLAHPKSAGHGIDGFQNVCNTIVFFGHWWDMELRQQIIERIGPTRQMQSGFDRPVFVYDIIAEDTIDEDVLLRHATKRDAQDLLLEATKRRRENG
jgi:SNF2 family DNA or RNA helicase